MVSFWPDLFKTQRLPSKIYPTCGTSKSRGIWWNTTNLLSHLNPRQSAQGKLLSGYSLEVVAVVETLLATEALYGMENMDYRHSPISHPFQGLFVLGVFHWSGLLTNPGRVDAPAIAAEARGSRPNSWRSCGRPLTRITPGGFAVLGSHLPLGDLEIKGEPFGTFTKNGIPKWENQKVKRSALGK